MDTTKPTPRSEQQANRRYLTVWRWHFYFGLLVAPFLTLLAITGLGMLLFANITGKEGERNTLPRRRRCSLCRRRRKRRGSL